MQTATLYDYARWLPSTRITWTIQGLADIPYDQSWRYKHIAELLGLGLVVSIGGRPNRYRSTPEIKGLWSRYKAAKATRVAAARADT